MTKRIGGNRRKTRHKLAKSVRTKGKVSLARYLQEFKAGDNVCLNAEPSIHEGMYYPRFHGKAGIIVGKQGKCYQVKIKDITLTKTVIVHPVHLKKV